jgi:hypothetical protein
MRCAFRFTRQEPTRMILPPRSYYRALATSVLFYGSFFTPYAIECAPHCNRLAVNDAFHPAPSNHSSPSQTPIRHVTTAQIHLSQPRENAHHPPPGHLRRQVRAHGHDSRCGRALQFLFSPAFTSRRAGDQLDAHLIAIGGLFVFVFLKGGCLQS